MATKKLSTAQQTLLSLLQGRVLTYRIGTGARLGVRSILDVLISGKKPEQKIALSTVEALINSGHVIVKSVDKNNVYTVILPCDNHAFSVMQGEIKKLSKEREEIAKKDYSEESEYLVATIDSKRRRLCHKMAYILMTQLSEEIQDAKYAHYICTLSELLSMSAAEKGYWVAEKAWWGKEIKRRRGAANEVEIPEVPAAPATEAPELKIAAREEEIGLFYSLVKEGQYVLAEAVIRKLIDDTSSDDKLHRHSLGTILLYQGKKEEAKKVYYALYESYRCDGDRQAAKQPLWEIIINCPDDESSIAYVRLGKLCEELGQYPDAIAVYTTAITDAGINEDYLHGLYRTHLAIGDEVKAQEYLAQAQSLADEREIAMGRCVPAPTVDRETATAIEQRHNVIVDVGSGMYTNDDPSHLNGYGATGWQPIPQVWIDEVKTPRHT